MTVFAVIGFIAAVVVGGYVAFVGWTLLRLAGAFGGAAKFEGVLGAAMLIAGLVILGFAFAWSPIHLSFTA